MSQTKDNPQFAQPASEAAGLKAVGISSKMIFGSMPIGKAMKVLNKLNQKQGVDCPGCAWPDPDTRSKLGEYCENGVKAIAEEAMSQKATSTFFSQNAVADMSNMSDYWLGQQGRLTQPMVIREGETHYQPIAWKDAFELIGKELNALAHPDEAIFYTSGRTSNEAAFLYQLFVRKYGTNNLPDCSNMCHESSGVGLSQTLGIGKGSVLLEDFEKAELILIFGQNPGTNHPRMLSALEKAKEKGAQVIVINPLKEAGLLRFKNPQKLKGIVGNGTSIADQYLQVSINEDVALMKAWMKLLIQWEAEGREVLDKKFIADRTIAFEALKTDLMQYELEELIERTGLSREEVLASAEVIASRQRIIACWAMGLTQHVNGVDNVREVVNLLLLKGSVGKPGAGTCPVRGHSNVQGDRTMGIHERPKKAWIDKLKDTFHFTPPASAGYNVVESIAAMRDQKAKVFIALGGNFVSAAPDTPVTVRALQNCQLTVHISTKLNRSHLTHGKVGLILPCLGRTDKHVQKSGVQFVTVENSMGIVHPSYGVLNPPSAQLKSEPEIVASMAAATLPEDDIDWLGLVEDYDKIRELIAKAVKGFEDYNKRLQTHNGFELPNGARYGDFQTPSGKAVFTVNRLADGRPEGHDFMMMTIRIHEYDHTPLIYAPVAII
ncbi:MAG: FdhF/YdeP family oxidoreductase [Bacteroidota bacterium]